MHELSLSMPEPMLSLSMLILAKSGQGLTSGGIPLGPVRARRGPVWVRILVVHRYGSIESSVRARRVPSGHIGHIGQSSVRSKNIKFGPKWVENRPFGPKQRPNEPNRLSGPIRTTPEAKNGQKINFLRKTAPRGPRPPPSLLSAQAGAYVHQSSN